MRKLLPLACLFTMSASADEALLPHQELAALLAKYPAAARSAATLPRALKDLDAFVRKHPIEIDLRFKARMHAFQLCDLSHQYMKGSKLGRLLLQEFPDDTGSGVRILRRMAEWQVKWNRRYAAREILEEIASKYPYLAKEVAQARLRKAELHTADGNYLAALRIYRDVAEKYAGRVETMIAAMKGMIESYARLGFWDPALATCDRLHRMVRPGSADAAWLALRVCRLRLNKGDPENACTAGQKVLAQFPDRLGVCRDALGYLIDGSLLLGRIEDAMAAARILHTLALGNVQAETAALELCTKVLKARDGHLASSRKYLLFIRWGHPGRDRRPGTKDDLPNPFANAAFKPDPYREELFNAALSRQPGTAEGLHSKGRLHLYCGNRKAALKDFRTAYGLASSDQALAGQLQREIRAIQTTMAE